MKKFISTGLLVATVWMGGAFAAQAEDTSASGYTPVKEGISIKEGFVKIWEETGIYRFIHPKTAEEIHAERLDSAIKTAEAEVSAGHLESGKKYIEMAEKLGADATVVQDLNAQYVDELEN